MVLFIYPRFRYDVIAYARRKIKALRIESVKRDGTLQCYAAILQKGAKKWEIQIGTDGKLIPPR